MNPYRNYIGQAGNLAAGDATDLGLPARSRQWLARRATEATRHPLLDSASAQRHLVPTKSGPRFTRNVRASVPLVVDLDGTLVRSDLLAESIFALAKKALLDCLKLPLWFASGRAGLKRKLAQRAQLDVSKLPYCRDLLIYLEAEKRRGRTLVLATAADESVARKVAAHVGLFDVILASDGHTNLAGREKAERLVAMFGAKRFDYIGNSWQDIAVWKEARKALLVQAGAWLRHRITKAVDVDYVFASDDHSPMVYLQALRWHQWFKNVLVFVPLLAAHRLFEPALLGGALLAFAAFSLCASSIYVLNDLIDLQTDRLHPVKKQRPLASGRLPIGHAVGLILVLLGATLAIGAMLPPLLLIVLALYFVLMLAYCLWLKDIPYIDALTLGTGYASRIVAGAAAVGMLASPWLLGVAVLFFSGLTLLKRYAELVTLHLHTGVQTRVRGYAGYSGGTIARVGKLSGILAVLVLATYGYIHQRQHAGFAFVAGVCVLLSYWMMHMWGLARQSRIAGDPVSFAYKDPTSQVIACLLSTVLLIAARFYAYN